jgi:uncharacterized protein HemY
MELSSGPKIIVAVGLMLVIIGGIWHFAGPSFSIGKLPGDIAIERQNFKFYFPVVSSILASVILTLLFWIFKKIF